MEGQITLEHFKLHLNRIVKQGKYGINVCAIDKNTNKHVIVKAIECKDDSFGIKRKLERLSEKLTHPYVVPILDVYSKDKMIWVVQEAEGTIDLDYYFRHNKLEEDEKLRFMHQLISAVNFLHHCEPEIIHGDIQPSNIWVIQQGGKVIVKLSECGVNGILKDKKIEFNYGSSHNTAPEVYEHNTCTKTADVFALGALFLTLVTNDGDEDKTLVPRSSTARKQDCNISLGEEMYHAKKKGLNPVTVVSASDGDTPIMKFCKQLITEMTKYETDQRMKLREIEPYLEQITGESIKTNVSRRNQAAQEGSQQFVETKPSDATNAGIADSILVRRQGSVPAEESDDSDDSDESDEDLGLNFIKNFALMAALAGLSDDKPKASKGPLAVGDYAIFASGLHEKVEVHSRFGDKVKKYLGSPGQIIEPKEDVWRVRFPDGTILNIGNSLLKKLDHNPSAFVKGDIVVIAKSKSMVMREAEDHGGWNDRMILNLDEKAVVVDVSDSGTVVLKGINGLRWAMSPKILTKMDEMSGPVKDQALVSITIDLIQLRRVQQKCNLWTEIMENVIGELGIVKRIYTNNIFEVETGIGARKFHRSVFKLVASHDECVKGIVLRQQYEEAHRRNVECPVS